MADHHAFDRGRERLAAGSRGLVASESFASVRDRITAALASLRARSSLTASAGVGG